MIRTLEATKFNIIANDPEVKQWIGYDEDAVVDLTNVISDINNYCFLTDDEDGGYILHNIGDGLYVAHTMSLKSARGKPMAQLMHDGFHFMFTATDCLEVSTLIPDGAVAAERWAKFSGFRNTFRRESFFNFQGSKVGGQFMTMTYSDWVSKAPKLKESGEAFHNFIETSLGHPNHPDDDIHDRFVGATILGCEEGNALKVINQYNRWALLAGYHPSTIVNASPLVINIGNALIQQYNGSMEILKVFEEHS